MFVDAATPPRKLSEDGAWCLEGGRAVARQQHTNQGEPSIAEASAWHQSPYTDPLWKEASCTAPDAGAVAMKPSLSGANPDYTFVDSIGNAFAPSFMVRVGDPNALSADALHPDMPWPGSGSTCAAQQPDHTSQGMQAMGFQNVHAFPAGMPQDVGGKDHVTMAQIGEQTYMLVPIPRQGDRDPAATASHDNERHYAPPYAHEQQHQQQHDEFMHQHAHSLALRQEHAAHEALRRPMQRGAPSVADYTGAPPFAAPEQPWMMPNGGHVGADGMLLPEFSDFINVFLDNEHNPLPHPAGDDAFNSHGAYHGSALRAAPGVHGWLDSANTGATSGFPSHHTLLDEVELLRDPAALDQLHSYYAAPGPAGYMPLSVQSEHGASAFDRSTPNTLFRRARAPASVPRRVGQSLHGGQRAKASSNPRTAAAPIMVGGAAVMPNNQRRHVAFGGEGLIRTNEVLGGIIRAGGPSHGKAHTARGNLSLQEKIAAACPGGSGDTAAHSVAGTDSTHGGSTSRKRKAAAQMASMNLDSSHHSTGRGSARRKALTGLSTDEHIRSLMSATETPEVLNEILAWEAQQPRSGKWKGVNARQWGKVGIEIRLTGQSRHEGPFTDVGKLVARFADIVVTAETASDPGLARGRSCASDGEKAGAVSKSNTVSSHSTGSPPRRPATHHGASEAENAVSSLRHSIKRAPSLDASNTSSKSQREPSQPTVSRQVLVWRNRGKDKAWLGTYHTPVNAAVHHDFFKVVLAVEGKIFTSRDMDACDYVAGRQRPHLLKMNFPLDELPELMRQSVAFTNLWHKYYQGSERYIFRDHDPAEVEKIVSDFITQHCDQLRNFIPPAFPQEIEGNLALPRTQPRRATKAAARTNLSRSLQADETAVGQDGEQQPGDAAMWDGAPAPDALLMQHFGFGELGVPHFERDDQLSSPLSGCSMAPR